ncbi:MAG: metallophosphoesterase family protein [Planctomycetes bacterium]|nr:metallophosphoesterase family protein [Planctomycetota bacterium]
MKIGIISDTHGRIKRLGRAIGILKARGAGMIVHCGDIGSCECVGLLGSSGLPVHAVAGNMDKNADELRQTAEICGVNFDAGSLIVSLSNGGKLGATHGDDQILLSQLAQEEGMKYVCHGHTHRTRDEKQGGVRMINPGAIYNPKNPSYPTAALLDDQTGAVEFIRIE